MFQLVTRHRWLLLAGLGLELKLEQESVISFRPVVRSNKMPKIWFAVGNVVFENPIGLHPGLE